MFAGYALTILVSGRPTARTETSLLGMLRRAPVGCVVDSAGRGSIIDLRSSSTILNLPQSKFSNPARSSYDISVGAKGTIAYLVCDPTKGADVFIASLPIRSNSVHWNHVKIPLSCGEKQKAGKKYREPVRLIQNTEYLAVIYDGPAIRLIDIKTLRTVATSVLGDPEPIGLPNGSVVKGLAMGPAGRDLALTIDSHQQEYQFQSELAWGAVGRRWRRAEPLYPGKQPESKILAKGVAPLGKHRWLFAYASGMALEVSESSRSLHKKRLAVSGSVRRWAFDPSNKCSYSVIGGKLAALTLSRWPQQEVSICSHEQRAVSGDIELIPASSWVLVPESESKVACYMRGHGWPPRYVFDYSTAAGFRFVGIHT